MCEVECRCVRVCIFSVGVKLFWGLEDKGDGVKNKCGVGSERSVCKVRG